MDASCESRLQDAEVNHSQQPLVFVTSKSDKSNKKNMPGGMIQVII